MTMVALRYDLRVPSFASTTHAAQYRACLDQCAWGDEHGVDAIVLSEHHGTDDGYLSAPVTLASAIAGCNRRAHITISALLVPLHDPVRLAEQLAAVDVLSGGRIGFVAGLGYRHEEFEMAGVDRSRRGALLEEYVDVMRRAWTGEPFEWRGRTIKVTPAPVSKPHPLMMIGGSTEIAARRAARLRLPFFPAIGDPALADTYRAECEAVGFEGGWVSLPNGPGMVMVSEDPDKTWAQIGPHALFDAQTYAGWQTPGQRSAVHVNASDADDPELRRVYQVVTPDECVALAHDGTLGTIVLHPLMGGIAPDLGWESLELFASKVLPRIKPAAAPAPS